jgi:hypothetical protein
MTQASAYQHVWDEMERRLRHLPNQPVTLAEMGPALIRIWNNIPQAFFNNLVRSMRRYIILTDYPRIQFHSYNVNTSGKKKLCITKKSIKDQYQNKIY